MDSIRKLRRQRARILAKVSKFSAYQESVLKLDPAVFESMEILASEQLIWSSDFEAIRKPLLRLIRAEARTGIHLLELERLCAAIADEGNLL